MAVATLNPPSQSLESSDQVIDEPLRIQIQLTHPLADSLAVSAGALLLTDFNTMQEKRKDLIFILVKKRHD